MFNIAKKLIGGQLNLPFREINRKKMWKLTAKTH